MAISPDGTRLAYLSGNPAALFVRKLDQRKAAELPRHGRRSDADFSPDGQWIGFRVGNKLNKISVDGGAVVPLLDRQGVYARASWGEEDGIYVQTDAQRGCVRIPEVRRLSYAARRFNRRRALHLNLSH